MFRGSTACGDGQNKSQKILEQNIEGKLWKPSHTLSNHSQSRNQAPRALLCSKSHHDSESYLFLENFDIARISRKFSTKLLKQNFKKNENGLFGYFSSFL